MIPELQQQQLRQRGQRREEEEASVVAASNKLRWRDGGNAPHKICGYGAAVDGRVAYFNSGWHEIVAYNSIPKHGLNFPGVLTIVLV